jgi:hypothetical protein
MSQNLQDLITKTLGVVPAHAPLAAPAAPKSHSGWAPARPTPMYEFRVDVSRSEYGSVYVTAADASDAYDSADSGDISWDDYGDINWGDTEQQSDDPVNQDELDEWDDQYDNKYDTDGEPKCSDCQTCYKASELTPNDDDDAWYCADCESNL